MSETRLVYSGQTGTLETVSLRFQKATAIYVENLENNLEVEFDCYLNVYVSNVETRKINLNNEREINVLNTIDIFSIPLEFSQSGLDMSVVIVSDNSININVYVQIPDCSCSSELEQIKSQLDTIQLTQIAQSVVTLGIGANQLAQNAGLVALASGVGLAFAPYTAGASLAISPAVAAPIGIGSAALIGTGLILP